MSKASPIFVLVNRNRTVAAVDFPGTESIGCLARSGYPGSLTASPTGIGFQLKSAQSVVRGSR